MKFDKKPSYQKEQETVGQAAYNLMMKGEKDSLQTQEIIDEYSEDFIAALKECAREGEKRHTFPFYILVLSNKEMWAPNVVRNRFLSRQTSPHGTMMGISYPNFVKILYIVKRTGCEFLWCLPSRDDIISIMKHPFLYSPSLVQGIADCARGKFDFDDYDPFP